MPEPISQEDEILVINLKSPWIKEFLYDIFLKTFFEE